MSIGKNAIKRVENNGYSKVQTSAPDMENSNVIAAPDPQVTEKLITPVEKATAKKTAGRTAAKPATKAPVKEGAKKPVPATKKTATNKPAANGTTAKKTANKPAQKKDTVTGGVQLGTDMPYYLL